MKLFTKKIISLLASVITAASTLSASYMSTFSVEQTNDTVLSSSADTEIKTQGLLGNLMSDEMEQFSQENDNNDQKNYLIYRMDFNEDHNKLIINYKAKNNCTIFIGFYSDDGTQMYTSLNQELVATSEQEPEHNVTIDIPEVPFTNYLVRAYMIGYLNEPLSEPLENNEATKAVQDIMKKSPEDFGNADDRIIRFSEYDDYNFIVTKNRFETVHSDETKDTLVSIDDETGLMIFENIDKFKSLKENQDVLVYTPDDMLFFRIDSIQVNGRTATVTKQLLDFRELIEFMKFDLSKYAGEFNPSLTTYESEYIADGYIKDPSTITENDWDNNLRKRSPLTKLILDGYQSDTLTSTMHFNFADFNTDKLKKKTNDHLSGHIKGSIEISTALKFKTYYEGDVFNVSGNLTKSFALDIEGEAAFTQKLGELKLPFGAVTFVIEPRIKLAAIGNLIYSKSESYDFNIAPFGDSYVIEHEPIEDYEGSIELELSLGLDIGVNFVTKYLLHLSVEPEIGIRATMEGVGENEYKRHNCEDNCVSVQAFIFGRITFHVELCGYDFNKKEDTKDEIGDYEFEACSEPKEFHMKNGVMYDGPCKNMSHKVIFHVYDVTDNAQAIKGKPVSEATLYIKIGNSSFSTLENDYGDAVETDSNGKAEAWIDDKILTDETCVVLAQSPNDKKGQVFVGQGFDISLKQANSFEILLDNDVDDSPSPSSSSNGFCGYDENVYDEEIVTVNNYNPTTHHIIHNDGTEEDLPSWTTWENYGDKKSGKVVVRVYKPTKDVKYEIDSSTCHVEGNGVLFSEYLLKKIRGNDEKVTTLIIDGGVIIKRGLYDFPCNEYCFTTYDGEFAYSGILNWNQNVKRVTLRGFNKIDSCSFQGCTNLSDINFDIPLKTIESFAFKGTKIESLYFPDTLETIGDNAFTGCNNLKEVSFNYGLESIGSYAFQGCDNLKEVKFNKRLKTIGEGAFDNTAIKSIDIPGSVSKIDSQAFMDCKNLSQITLTEGLHTICRKAFYNTPITKINIPSSVKIIENDAFNKCSNLKTVIINGDIETIEVGAFGSGENGFYPINTIILNNGVTEIPECAFKNINSLKDIRFSQNLKTINNYAFGDCDSLSVIYLPDSLEYLEEGAFNNCNSLRSVNLPQNLKYIGNEAFCNNTSLKSIIIPASVKKIGDYAFARTPLNSLTIKNGVEEIGESAFAQTKIKSLEIPPSVEKIEKNAFNTAFTEQSNNDKNVYIYKTTLSDVYIYNPDCVLTEEFIEHNETYKVTLHGYKDSTAYKYYEKYPDYVNFEEISSEPVTTTTTTAVTTTATTKATTIVTTNVSPNSECVMIALNGIKVNENTPSNEILDNQNLRYFDQKTADGNGVVTFSYVPNVDENWSFMFISQAIDNMIQKSFGAIDDLKTVSESVSDADDNGSDEESESTVVGDANGDGQVDMGDAVLIMQALANPNKYGLNGTAEIHLTARGYKYGDVEGDGNGITANDALKIQKYLLGQIASLR